LQQHVYAVRQGQVSTYLVLAVLHKWIILAVWSTARQGAAGGGGCCQNIADLVYASKERQTTADGHRSIVCTRKCKRTTGPSCTSACRALLDASLAGIGATQVSRSVALTAIVTLCVRGTLSCKRGPHESSQTTSRVTDSVSPVENLYSAILDVSPWKSHDF
jgi:hypothetical protein